MFYSQFILAKKGPLGTIWIAAHLERKLRKNQVADTDIGVSVDSILFPDVPIALRLSSHLLLGVVRIYSRKVNYLFDDCSEALLKIKQAFRSTAVDLPPEESTAPYHSITLPETFDLDDFELPDNDIFQGNYVDHHISTKEQITLQDTMDGVVYSTSQFGLDERFGDGDTSQIGLDLDEDLFLSRVAAPEDSGIHLDPGADPQASSQPPATLMDEDNEELDEPLQTTTTKVDEDQGEEQPVSTEPADYAHAPSTPGLLEEPNLLNVQKALASDDHLESEDHNSADLEVTKNAGKGISNADNSGDKGVLDPPLLHSRDADTILAEENGHLKGELAIESHDLYDNSTAEDMAQVASDRISELSADSGHVKLLDNGLLNDSRQIVDQGGKTGLDEPVASPSISHGVEDSTHGSRTAEQLPDMLCTDSINETLSKSLKENGVCTNIATSDHVEESCLNGDQDVPNFHDPDEDKILNPAEHTPLTGIAVLKACHYQPNKPSLNNGNVPNISDLKSSELCSTDLPGREDELHASGEIQVEGCLPTDVIHPVTTGKQLSSNSDKENEMEHVQLDQDDMAVSKGQLESISPATSELPAPEKLLSMPEDANDIQNGLSLDSTPAKDIQEENDDGASGTVITGKKRSFTESTLTLESLNSDVSFAKGPSMRTVESIPDDDDLLSSILVGRKSSFLKLKPTPPAEAAPAKRARTAPRASSFKRKVPVDDMMVLHGDAIREQLTSTEDIRRVRKKAPCTPHEVWMMHKQFLEEEFFNDPISSGLSVELICLYNQPLDLSGISISKVEERIACPQSAQHEHSERSNACTEGDKDGKHEILMFSKEGEEQTAEMELERDNATVACLVDQSKDPGVESSSASVAPVLESSVALDHAEAPGVDSLSPTLNIESTRDFPSGPRDELQTDTAFPSSNHTCDTFDDSFKLENNGPSVDGGDVIVGDNQNSVIESDSRFMDDPMSEQKIDDSIDKEVGLYTDSSAPIGNSEPLTALLAEADRSGEPGDLTPELQDGATNQPLDCLSAEPEMDPSHPVFPQEEADVDMRDVALNDEQSGLLNDLEEPFVLGTTEAQGISDRETTDLDHPAFDNTNDAEHMINGEHDTGFLNDDDDIDEEDDNSAPSTDAPNILENTGWSSRTRAVAKYLQILFDKEAEHPKRVVPVDNLLSGKTRKEASRMFFETLVLKTRDYIHVEQSRPFDNICIKPQSRLMKSNF